jgi:hypothetical protein
VVDKELKASVHNNFCFLDIIVMRNVLGNKLLVSLKTSPKIF